MNIASVVSLQSGWGKFTDERKRIVDNILDEYENCSSKRVLNQPKFFSILKSDHWRWMKFHRDDKDFSEHLGYQNYLGHQKDDLMIHFHRAETDFFQWFGRLTELYQEESFDFLPIYISPYDSEESQNLIEFIVRELENGRPYSFLFPFIVIVNSRYVKYSKPKEIHEVINAYFLNREILSRAIEFPPEFRTAGANILGFFSEYLHDNYPEAEVKVKIEQDGSLVRMIIEGDDGQREVVKRALNDYTLMVSGKEKPENLISNDLLVVKMQGQIDIIKAQLQMSQNLLQVERGKSKDLMQLISDGLKAKSNIAVQVNQNSHTNIAITLNQDISLAAGNLGELLETIKPDTDSHNKLSGLRDSLESIEKVDDPAVIKKSPVMSRFKRILEEMGDEESTLSKTIMGIKNGVDIARDLAGKYNSIAEWCGLPQVPRLFTK